MGMNILRCILTQQEVARAHIASQSVKMGSGMLVTVPVPKDQEGDAESIEIGTASMFSFPFP